MKSKRSASDLVCTVLALVLVLGCIGAVVLVLVQAYQSHQAFAPGEHFHKYEQGLPDGYAERKDLLAEWGVEFSSIPGSHGQPLTFTTPKAVGLYDKGLIKAAYRTALPKGTQVTCDFVVWSKSTGDGSNSYRIAVIVDGEALDTTMKRRDVTAMFKAALEQNGLADQFLADTGEPLNSRSAKKALQTINRQLYTLGIYFPAGYPYDNEGLLRIFLLGIPLSPVLAFGMGAVYLYLRAARADRAYLEAYNAEHIASWNRKAGHLPQFESLTQSGIRAPGKQPTRRERFRGMFQPVAKQ